MTKLFVRIIYLPLFLFGGNGLAIATLEAGHSKLWLVAIGLGFVCVAFLLEHVAPYNEDFNRSYGDRVRDFCHFVVNESANVIGLLSLPLIVSLISIPSVWPVALPLWQQLLIAIIVADVGITLAHFASHRVDALWRLHAVHHSVKRMYGFNGLMKHPLHQLVETLAGTTPLILLGIPPDVMSLLIVAVVLQLLLQHSNVAYFTGPFKYLLAINVLHRFHHLKSAEEGDVNFGLFTTLTDRILGTAFYDKNRVFVSDDLGIGAEPDYPTEYMAQMIRPFRRQEGS